MQTNKKKNNSKALDIFLRMRGMEDREKESEYK